MCFVGDHAVVACLRRRVSDDNGSTVGHTFADSVHRGVLLLLHFIHALMSLAVESFVLLGLLLGALCVASHLDETLTLLSGCRLIYRQGKGKS